MDLQYHSFHVCASVFSSIFYEKTQSILVFFYRKFTKTMGAEVKLKSIDPDAPRRAAEYRIAKGRIPYEITETGRLSLPLLLSALDRAERGVCRRQCGGRAGGILRQL